MNRGDQTENRLTLTRDHAINEPGGDVQEISDQKAHG